MTDIAFGHIITDEDAANDAVHFAVAPVVAAVPLKAGQHVNIKNGLATNLTKETIGIVDPFIKGPINIGDRFYLFLYPNSVTSLRHAWTHPSFPEELRTKLPDPMPKLSPSEEWITRFAQEECDGLTFDAIIEAAQNYLKYDDYLNHGPRFEGCSIPNEFWTHFERVTGTLVPPNKRHSFFSCSC